MLTSFEKVEPTPVEDKTPKPRKKKENPRIKTVKTEENHINKKSVDKILQFIERDDKKKENNNNGHIKKGKKKKGRNKNMQKKEEKK